MWLIGQPLQADLERRLDRPVRIANDANCFAVSEATDGAAVGAEVVFGVIGRVGQARGRSESEDALNTNRRRDDLEHLHGQPRKTRCESRLRAEFEGHRACERDECTAQVEPCPACTHMSGHSHSFRVSLPRGAGRFLSPRA